MNLLDNRSIQPSSKDYAYDEIKARIWRFDLLPGEAISEEKLGKTLEISRTPLREALSILEYEKLIVRQPNKRLKVSDISIKEAKEIFEVRSVLEKIAVVQATQNATETDFENMRMIVKGISQMSLKNNEEKILSYGEQFHQYIYYMSQNETVKTILGNLHNHVRRYRGLIISHRTEQPHSENHEHMLILKAMEQGEGKKAAETMQNHLEESLESAIKLLKDYEAGVIKL